MKSLYELAVHYQKTGEVLSEVSDYQLAYLLENMQEFFDEYIQEYEFVGMSFQDHVARRVSDWLVDNGFGKDITPEFIQELEEEAEEAKYDSLLVGRKKNGKDTPGTH